MRGLVFLVPGLQGFIYGWGLGGVLMFKIFQGNRKVVFGRLGTILGVKFEFKSQFEIFAA